MLKKLFKNYLPVKIYLAKNQFTNQLQLFRKKIWIVFEKVKRKFYGPQFPDIQKFGVNLHLGCGNINHNAFINVDGFPFPNVHYIRDLSDLSIFDDNSVDLIYASHCLEHFHYNDINGVLKEWNRVLKLGGILRLSVPDFDLLLNIYYENDMNPDYIIPQLMGGQNNEFNFHYMIFNKVNLKEILRAIGFDKITEWTPNSSVMTTFDDFSSYCKEVNKVKYPVSLNLEAFKK